MFLKHSRLHILSVQMAPKVCDPYEQTLLLYSYFLLGVTRKQLGLTFLGETRQDLVSVIGDICLEIEGVDRKVRAIFLDEISSGSGWLI